jgi:flagellar hook assembly protein FlgD
MDINLIPITSNPENPVTPSLTRVIGCYPNPFNSQTVIRYAISKQDLLTLDIYNLKGQKIRSLLHQTQTPGEHDIVWNGYTDYGIRAACGIYLYKLQTGATTLTGKLMLSE